MADEDIIGIIQVPLHAFTYQAGKGREKDPAIVKHLSDVFNKEGCNPDQWEHHIKGEVDAATYGRLLIALSLSEDKFRNTVKTGEYPQVRLRKRIVCLDGRQRIAAARGKFGKHFWWPVKLFRDSRVSRFSHQTRYPDGEICWHMFRLALGKPDLGGDWTSELTKSKRKILNVLLRRENGVLKYGDFVDALCDVLEFPGARRGFKLGNMHKYTPLRCLEFPVRYLRRMSRIYLRLAGHASVVPHMDSKTIGCFQYRNPSNSADENYITLMMDTREAFRGVKSASVRRSIKQELLSLDVIFPSFETFHQNMIYFSVGAKILRSHIIDDPDKFQERDKEGDLGLFKSLQKCWTQPKRPFIEVSDGIFQPLVSLDVELACMLLFLDGLRDCLYLSKEPILQDRRGEPAPVADVDPWYISRLRARASRYGFRTKKISRGLAAKPPPPRQLDWDLDWDARAKDWRGGKPTVRNFLDLQRDAFLPILEQADSRTTVTPAVVLKDFLEAFFGSWSYMIDGPQIPSDPGPLPGGEAMEIDEDGPRPAHESASPVHRGPPPSQPQNQSTQQTQQGLEQHQTQTILQELPSKKASPHQMPEVLDLTTPPALQMPVLDPAMQVDQPEPTLAEIFENRLTGSSIQSTSSRNRPLRRNHTDQRSRSPTNRVPASRYRRNWSPLGPSRSPIRPPTRALPPTGSQTAIEELARQRSMHPPQDPTQPSPALEAESQGLSVEPGDVGLLQEPVVSYITKQQTTPTQDRNKNHGAVRQQITRRFRFDPIRRPDWTKEKPSKRSPVRPPKPVTTGGPPEATSAGIWRDRLAAAARTPAPTVNSPQYQNTRRRTVRQQREEIVPSERSPIRPPRVTSPAVIPVSELAQDNPSRRSPIRPTTQRMPRVPETPQVTGTLTAERPVYQIPGPRTAGPVLQTTGNSNQNEDIDSHPRAGSSKRPPILPPKTLHNSQKTTSDYLSVKQTAAGAQRPGHPSRRSHVVPPNTTAPRRSERIRLLSQEPPGPTPQTSSASQASQRVAENKSAKEKIIQNRVRRRQSSPDTDPPDNQTPRRSKRIRLLSKEPSSPSVLVPSSSQPPQGLTESKSARKKMTQDGMRSVSIRQNSQGIDPPNTQTPRRSERIRLLSQEPPGQPHGAPSTSQPSQRVTENQDARRKLKKARRRSHRPRMIPRHTKASHERHTLADTHARPERPEHQDGIHQVAGVVRKTDQPATILDASPKRAHLPAPPREMAGGKKHKGEADQLPTETDFDQRDISVKQVPARLPHEQPSGSRHPRSQPRRSPIRPPGAGFRVPSISSQESLRAAKTFRVPSASSAESLQATMRFRVPSASSAESLQGRQRRSPIRPPRTRSTAPSMSHEETFRRERPSPMRCPRSPLSPGTDAPGAAIGDAKQAKFPEVSQNTDLERLREFQPFSESRAQYPLPDDLPEEEEEW